MGIALPILSIGSAVLGAGMGVAGGIGAAHAQQAQAQYQAQVAKNNQTIARYNQQNAEYDAARTAAAGEAAATAEGLKGAANYGDIVAGQAASGIDVNSGSAVNVRSSAAALNQLNTMTIKSDSAREAYGYRLRGYGYGLEAQRYGQEAQLAREGAPTGGDIGLGIATSVLGSASSIASSAYNIDRVGGFGGNRTLDTSQLSSGDGPAMGSLY